MSAALRRLKRSAARAARQNRVWGVLAALLSVIPATFGAQADPARKVHRVGLLDRTSPSANAANIGGLRRGLRELGYAEGTDYVLEYRSADGRDERFPALAAELVRLNADVIVTRGTPAALAAKGATRTIPVIMTGVGDPVGQGLVASLARPEGNLTGLSATVTDAYPKRVQLLAELVPKMRRIAVLFNMSNPALPPQWKEVEQAARARGIQAELLDVRKVEDLEPAFDAAVRHRADGLVVGIDTLTLANQALIVELAARRRLPAIYASTEFAGGLMSYGVNYPEMYRRAAYFADKIWRGARAADLPVEEPTTLELVINRKAVRALKLQIPPSLLLRAEPSEPAAARERDSPPWARAAQWAASPDIACPELASLRVAPLLSRSSAHDAAS